MASTADSRERANSPKNNSTAQPSSSKPTQAWLLNHAYTAVLTLRRLLRAPLAAMMTIFVIGIAIALPTGLYQILNGAHIFSAQWDDAARISLFLHSRINADKASDIATDLEKRIDVAEVTLITPDEALLEFRDHAGFGDILDSLDENPLPAVLIVAPTDSTSTTSINKLRTYLEGLSSVEHVQMDMAWLERLQHILALLKRSVLLLGSLLSFAVLLIIGNTIRLEILNRQEEIKITKLIGATNAFVRRPFLYTGAWYGLLGGLIGVLLVTILVAALQGPLAELATLYNTENLDISLDGNSLAIAIMLSVLLGFLGAWVSVGRHLRSIEPS